MGEGIVDSKRARVASVASLIVGIIGIIGSLYLFVLNYRDLIQAEIAAGSPSEAVVVTYVFPMLTDLETLAGIGFLVAAYGFAKGRGWAWLVAVVANVVGLMPSFFQMIPPMSRGLFPSHLYTFIPYLLMYMVLLLYVRPVGTFRFLLSLFTGIAYVLTFMNGIAGINRIVEVGSPIFIVTQQLNWAGAISWAVVTVAVLYGVRWTMPVGLLAGLAGIIGGTPLAVLSTIENGRFSMFTPAPALSLILLIFLVLYEKRLHQEKPTTSTRSSSTSSRSVSV